MSRTKGLLRARPVDEHIRIDDEGHAVRVVETRRRYGGVDAGASIAGALTALGVTVLLAGLLGGIGTVGYQLDLERGTDELSLAGLIGGLVTLVVAFLIGGWVAGRIARYDGGLNGLLTAVWFLLAAAALAGLGAWLGERYDVFDDLQVPRWFDENATTWAAVVSGVVAAIVMLVAGWLGGVAGGRYHKRADAYLEAETRDRFTGHEPFESTDHAGRRHVTGAGSDLRTEDAEDDLARQRDEAYQAGVRDARAERDERIRAEADTRDEQHAGGSDR